MSAERITAKIRAIAAKVKADAAQKRESAGWGGRMDDGGAGHLLSMLEVWQAGLRGEIPPVFQEYAEQAEKESDPEWAEFQRLQKKFGK